MEPSRRGAFDVRMKGFRDRADVADLVRLIDDRIGPLPTEHLSVLRAAGRRLAAPVAARCSVPGFDRSAMDGYAVRGADTFGSSPFNELDLRIVGEALPGQPWAGTLSPGQAVRIMTGAPLPRGADAVLVAESAREEVDRVLVREPTPPGKNVSRQGEDVAAGQTILVPPRTLRPQDIGVCAAAGVAEIPVVRQPIVAIVVTGDELVPAGSIPPLGRIVDSNSVLLRALVERDGGIVASPSGAPIPILPDDRGVIQMALEHCDADCLLVSGGSSVGKEDHAPGLVEELGELLIHGLALRPASPTGFGIIGDRPVFLLPGNPVSCLCAYDLFAGRAIRLLGGRPGDWPYPARTMALARKISSAVGRVDYVRVRLREDGLVEPIAVSGAAILSSTTRADGFVLVPKDLEGYPEGTEVLVHLYDIEAGKPGGFIGSRSSGLRTRGSDQ